MPWSHLAQETQLHGPEAWGSIARLQSAQMHIAPGVTTFGF